MRIKRSVYRTILRTVPSVPPETGGILGSRNGIVAAVCFDAGPPASLPECAVYRPNTERLNHQIAVWAQEGLSFCGIFHSHLPHEHGLSSGDLVYIQSIFQNCKQLSELYVPLVIPETRLIPFLAFRNGTDIRIVSENLDFEEEVPYETFK